MTTADQPTEEKQDVRRGLNLLGLQKPEYMTIEEFETYWQRAQSVNEAKALLGLLPHMEVVSQSWNGERRRGYFLTDYDPLEFLCDIAGQPAEPHSAVREIQVRALRSIGTLLNKEGKIDSVSLALDDPLTMKVVKVAEAWMKSEGGSGDGGRGVNALIGLATKKLVRVIGEDQTWSWHLWNDPFHHTPKDDERRELEIAPIRQRLVNLVLDNDRQHNNWNHQMFGAWPVQPILLRPTVEAIATYIRFAIPDLPEGLPDDPLLMVQAEPFFQYQAILLSRENHDLGEEQQLIHRELGLLRLLHMTSHSARINELKFSKPKPKEENDE